MLRLMAEVGAKPKVPVVRRRALEAVRSLFSPLLPDDYLELINPLWSTRELRGRIERIEREADNAVTVLIKPGFDWEGHEPGQYLRIGVVVDGIHHWRAYSLTSDPDRSDGCISITPKLVQEGKVSPYFVREATPGEIVRLGGVEGTFTLPDPVPPKLFFISAGSGITPIMSMLRHLDRVGAGPDVVHVHSARTADDVIFGDQLNEIDSRQADFKLNLRLTGAQGRLEANRHRRALPRLARARDVPLWPGRVARRDDRPLGGARRPRSATCGALPAGDRRRGRRRG